MGLVDRLRRRLPRLFEALEFVRAEANYPGEAPAHMRHKSRFYTPDGGPMPEPQVTEVDPEAVRKAAVERRTEGGRQTTEQGSYWFLDAEEGEDWSETDPTQEPKEPEG